MPSIYQAQSAWYLDRPFTKHSALGIWRVLFHNLDLRITEYYIRFHFGGHAKIVIVERTRMRGPKMGGLRKLIVEENLGSKGARATVSAPYTDPGLPPHTPHVKNTPGGSTPPSSNYTPKVRRFANDPGFHRNSTFSISALFSGISQN